MTSEEIKPEPVVNKTVASMLDVRAATIRVAYSAMQAIREEVGEAYEGPFDEMSAERFEAYLRHVIEIEDDPEHTAGMQGQLPRIKDDVFKAIVLSMMIAHKEMILELNQTFAQGDVVKFKGHTQDQKRFSMVIDEMDDEHVRCVWYDYSTKDFRNEWLSPHVLTKDMRC